MKIITRLKPLGRIVKAAHGFLYNFIRYCLYSNARENVTDSKTRNYISVKIYHSLEKSMSYKNRSSSHGWAAAFSLMEHCKAINRSENIGHHDRVALSVLNRFINLEGNIDRPEANKIRCEIEKFDFLSAEDNGYYSLSKDEMTAGKLEFPENFFRSRFSLREFSPVAVEKDLIEKAISLAMKTPSACNRQPWFVYQITNPDIKKAALKLQTGNAGFGNKIPNLLVIAADLNAFIPGQEHYQHWIDGGMFSMSIVYALHSLGVASCCLNWSQTPGADRALRKIVKIQDSHSIIMMLAVGWPDKENLVCVSPRRPFHEIYKEII